MGLTALLDGRFWRELFLLQMMTSESTVTACGNDRLTQILAGSSRAGGHAHPGFGSREVARINTIWFHSTRRNRSVLSCGMNARGEGFEFDFDSPFPESGGCANIRSSAKASS
jgi:hypothetical protein